MKLLSLLLLIQVFSYSYASETTNLYVYDNFNKALDNYNKANRSLVIISEQCDDRCVGLEKEISYDKARERIKYLGRKYRRLGEIRSTMKSSSEEFETLWNKYKDGDSWSAHVSVDKRVYEVTDVRKRLKNCIRGHAVSAFDQVYSEFVNYYNQSYSTSFESICSYRFNMSTSVDSKITLCKKKVRDVKELSRERYSKKASFAQTLELFNLINDEIDDSASLNQLEDYNNHLIKTFGESEDYLDSSTQECIDYGENAIQKMQSWLD